MALDAPSFSVELEEPQAPCCWSGELQSLNDGFGIG